MSKPRVMISGAGIGGLTTALTLNQLGIDCVLFEAAAGLKHDHMGLNLQPNAVRELYDLGFTAADLDAVGVPAREWALVGLNGNDIYAEPRGLEAGYNWPQYAVQRCAFKKMLYDELIGRAGPEAVRFDAFVTGYKIEDDGSVTVQVEHDDGSVTEDHGTLLIAADGIYSSVRAQMYPDQAPVRYKNTLLYQGVTRAKPVRTGSSFVGLGTTHLQIIMYPISAPDQNGEALINWYVVQRDAPAERVKSSRFRLASPDELADQVQNFRYKWLDVPEMLSNAIGVHERPMYDRDPVKSWVDGSVALLGDAAHPMIPSGSTGPSQAVMDARVLGAKILQHGATPAALAAYDDELCEPVSKLVLRNRDDGPFALLDLVDERCGGNFDDIDDVISGAERLAFMARYKSAAGFAVKKLNSAAPTIMLDGAQGATVVNMT
ncbi:MAG: flavin-dependent oxidoreductase [Maritimibacter sp.]